MPLLCFSELATDNTSFVVDSTYKSKDRRKQEFKI